MGEGGELVEVRAGQVQQLSADLALLPLEGRFRIAIIEKAHRLNEDAQNALLKTLEEPPAAVVIVGAVGATRLYLGVLWFTDVVGGYALGALWLAVVLSCMLGFAGRRARGTAKEPLLGGGATAPTRRQPARTKTE